MPVGAQVSCNLIDPRGTSLADLYDTVAAGPGPPGAPWSGPSWSACCPRSTLRAVPPAALEQLDLGQDRTIEFRMAEQGFPAGGG